jgi:hypothetical protein
VNTTGGALRTGSAPDSGAKNKVPALSACGIASRLNVADAKPNSATAFFSVSNWVVLVPAVLRSLASSSVTSSIGLPATPPRALTDLKYASAPSRTSRPIAALPPVNGADWPMTQASCACAGAASVVAINIAASELLALQLDRSAWLIRCTSQNMLIIPK